MSDLITIKEAATRIGCCPTLLQKRCRDGTIPAMRVGTDYRVQWADIEEWLKRKPTATPRLASRGAEQPEELKRLIESWEAYLSHVRAFSPTTLELYRVLLRSYIKRMAAIGQGTLRVESLFDRRTVLAVFAKIPSRSYSTKMNTYLVLRSFGTFLISEGRLSGALLEELKPLKPRRQVEPRRTHLKIDDVARLFDAILTRTNSPAENLTFAAMVACMVYSGLRVSEVCKLRPIDVDLEARTIVVRHGKGGKDRRVGICTSLFPYLREYLAIRQIETAQFFVQSDGLPFDRHMVAKRMKLMSGRLGVDITAHGLRRTFATLSTARGRSVNHVRIALGHTNLATTQAYLRTSETEVIEAMKGW